MVGSQIWELGAVCSPSSSSLASQGPEALLGCHTSSVVNPNQSLAGRCWPMAAVTGLCWATTTLCVPAQNILGLQGIPRQFFLQVYETLRRIGETRSASLPCATALPVPTAWVGCH